MVMGEPHLVLSINMYSKRFSFEFQTRVSAKKIVLLHGLFLQSPLFLPAAPLIVHTVAAIQPIKRLAERETQLVHLQGA
jgi:hypothetical protein